MFSVMIPCVCSWGAGVGFWIVNLGGLLDLSPENCIPDRYCRRFWTIIPPGNFGRVLTVRIRKVPFVVRETSVTRHVS